MKIHTNCLPAAVLLLFTLAGAAVVQGQDTKLRWDLISLQFSTPPVLSPGGTASAVANDANGMPKLRITLTGSGTFTQWDPTDVTGGGNYTITDLKGNTVDSGSYTVTALVSWVFDSVQPPGLVNNITNTSTPDGRNGLAVFRTVFKDGSKGLLIVSCHGPGAGDDPYEGISVIKGELHFQVPDAPKANVDANRTVFLTIQ